MRRSKRSRRERLRRGIYILPNIFTSLNIFFGFYAVIAAVSGNFVPAAYAVYIAAVFDLLDGKIARATNTTSRFGVEYDSLADLVSFGLAPGQRVLIAISGWITFGVSCLGRRSWAIKPKIRIKITPTVMTTGLRREKRIIFLSLDQERYVHSL